MRKNEESRIQQACVLWFRLQHTSLAGLLFAIPNGGYRNAVTGAILKAEGVLAGVSDLILLYPSGKYHGLCVEMKTPKGRQQETQRAFQRRVERAGYKYAICRGIDEFKEVISKYLKREEDEED